MSDASAAARGTQFQRVASRFASLDALLLAVRAMAWALVLPIVKHLVPIRSLVAFMRRDPVLASRDPQLEDRILAFSRWSARLVRWSAGGNCLERALIAYRYLCAAKADPVLVMGVDRPEAGGVRGHAWVLVDGKPAGESYSSVADFTPMIAFDASGQALPRP
jgi:hypothetical protein